MRHLGVDMIEFCSRPDLGERFGEAERRAVVHGVMDFLRRGLAVQGAGAAMTSGDLIEAAQDNLRQLIGDES